MPLDKEFASSLVTFLEQWKAGAEARGLIPTVELLLEELNEAYGTDAKEREEEGRDRE